MTSTLTVRDEPRASGARRARLYVALQASRPLAGSVRLSLAGIEEARIGRGEAASVSRELHDDVQRLTVAIPDLRLSSEHARIVRLGTQWVVEDLGSKNGTRVNDRSVERAVLRDGDRLLMGGAFFLYSERVEDGEEPGDADRTSLAAAAPGLGSVIPEVARRLAKLAGIAPSPVSVLVTGESGTGKELAARAVHAVSARPGRFVAVNCAAIPANLVESELFGHKRGAFSGASEDKPGLVRAADRGTLLLDEIGDLPLPAQGALLRVLQEREVVAVGATQPAKVDVRIVAATHRNVDELVASGKLRADLMARLRGFALELPPLRERRADLGLLLADILERLAPGRAASVEITLDAARALFAHDWPLNVRELEQALAAAVAFAIENRIEIGHLPAAVRVPQRQPAEELDAADLALRDRVAALLREHGGNVSAVARAMGKERKQIRRWIERFDLRDVAVPDEE